MIRHFLPSAVEGGARLEAGTGHWRGLGESDRLAGRAHHGYPRGRLGEGLSTLLLPGFTLAIRVVPAPLDALLMALVRPAVARRPALLSAFLAAVDLAAKAASAHAKRRTASPAQQQVQNRCRRQCSRLAQANGREWTSARRKWDALHERIACAASQEGATTQPAPAAPTAGAFFRSYATPKRARAGAAGLTAGGMTGAPQRPLVRKPRFPAAIHTPPPGRSPPPPGASGS